jgi:hypothetical protein
MIHAGGIASATVLARWSSTCLPEELMTVRRSNPVVSPVPAAPRPMVSAPLLFGLAASAFVASVAITARAHALPIERTLFTWSGRVDREVFISIRGRELRTTGADANLPNRARVTDALPRGRGDVLVQLNDGRGVVDVIEQPSLANGYRAVIRIRDPRGGADNYRVTAYWASDDRNSDRIDDRNDRRSDRDRDGDRDRDRDRDRGNNGNGSGWGRGGRDDRDDRNRGRDDRDDRNRGRDDRSTGRESGSLRWSGRVDDVIELRISGRRVDAITRSGAPVREVNSSIRGSGLPSRAVEVRIEQLAGRGTVQVVQQPSSWNGYTAVLRIYDPRGGAVFYDFTASW